MNSQDKITPIGRLLCFTCFITIISQLPLLIDRGLNNVFSSGIWIFFLVFMMLYKKQILLYHSMLGPLMTFVGLSLFMLCMRVVSHGGYWESSLFRNIALATFVLWCGSYIGNYVTQKDLEAAGKAYVLASVVVAINIYLEFFRGADISGVSYLYATKNSIAVILVTAIIIVLQQGFKKKFLPNLINIFIIAFLVFLILIMKCRAMIVALPIIVAVTIVASPRTTRVKGIAVLLCIASLILLSNDGLYDVFLNDILYAGRGSTLAEASSGRMGEWSRFFVDMKGKWALGDGKTKREALILASYMQYGVIIGSVVIAYAVWPLIWSVKKGFRRHANVFLLFLIAMTYVLDSFFEQLAPFGPGVRCFYLWFLLGILMANPRLRGEYSQQNIVEEESIERN